LITNPDPTAMAGSFPGFGYGIPTLTPMSPRPNFNQRSLHQFSVISPTSAHRVGPYLKPSGRPAYIYR